MERLRTVIAGEAGSHILPFLWMKGEDNETIGRELDRIEECGIREVCLESRPHPDFCGPGWWENLDFVCGEARKRGMRLWILDDDKFPTGHANGGFERRPDRSKLYLAERHMDICGPCSSGAVLVENFCGVRGGALGRNAQIGSFPDEKLLGILAVPKPDGETLAVAGEGILDLTDNCENGFVYFDLPEGTWRLFVLFTTRKGGGRDAYMNLIDSDSVRVLIEEVYEKHYARYGEYFGNTIAGFFSDEPELGNAQGYPFDNALGQKDGKIPWSRELEALLRKDWGTHFLENLPALWYPSGEKTAMVRFVYMDRMTELVERCFSGQIGSWCKEHGVAYIGHIIEDDNAHTRMGCSIGHYFREMAGQHMAGIDVVHHQIVPGFTEPVHQWIAGDRDGEFFQFGLAKLGSSASHIQRNKKGRALCEIFGNYGWAEGNSFMKWLTNHMLVRGINQFTPHAFSMRYPDPDCPPHFYAGGNNPGFPCFAQLMKYMNRAAHLLGCGVHMADAAILYHAESEWCGGAYMYYQKPGRKLMEHGLDYDVVPADLFGEALRADAGNDGQEAVRRRGRAERCGGHRVADREAIYCRTKVREGRLWIGEENYVCLILPYAQYLDRDVVRFVEEAGGLKVFVVDALPEGDIYGNPLPDCWEERVEVVSLENLARRVADLAESSGSRELIVQRTGEWEASGRMDSPERDGSGAAGEKEEAFPGLRSFLVRQPDGVAAMYFNESVSHGYHGRIRVKNPIYDTAVIYDPWQNRGRRYALREMWQTCASAPADGLGSASGSVSGIGKIAGISDTEGAGEVSGMWGKAVGTYAEKEIPLHLEPGEALIYCFESGGSVGEAEAPGATGRDEEIFAEERTEERPGRNAGEVTEELRMWNTAGKFPVLQDSAVLDIDWSVHKIPLEDSKRGSLPETGTAKKQGEALRLPAGEPLPNLNGPGYWPSFVGTYVYEGSFCQKKEDGKRYFLLFEEVSDSLRLVLNGEDLGFLAGFPARVEITRALARGGNRIRVEVTTTLVWKLKDGASTHLQVPASGMTKPPVLQTVV